MKLTDNPIQKKVTIFQSFMKIVFRVKPYIKDLKMNNNDSIRYAPIRYGSFVSLFKTSPDFNDMGFSDSFM